MNEEQIKQLIDKKIKAEKESLAKSVEDMFGFKGEIVNATALIIVINEWAEN